MSPAESVASHRDSLLNFIRQWSSCVVAYSGGVDSAVVAQAAYLALGSSALAVTGVSASLAAGELEAAQQLAAQIGIRHDVVQTHEVENPDYASNSPQRCYHCKTELYGQLQHVARHVGAEVIFNGTIVDDLGDYRPGLTAAAEHRVESPLAACGFDKQAVRDLAAHWKLPVADKPASPCLSSRIAFGEEVTPERLAMIDQAEALLRSLGMTTLRVRYHRGDLARIEVPLESIGELCEPAVRAWIVDEFTTLGFKYVSLDLAGHRSGSQNAVLPLETLMHKSHD